jgi:UDP-GlcNAc:undecaprenyl-phosphate/decaprenyl-phosphate GlcNAc-1-phosphate transferase
MNVFFDIAYLPMSTAFIATVLLTPFIISIAKKVNLLDDPKRRTHPGVIHTTPTPRGGGIALFIGVLIAALIFLPFNYTTVAIFFASFLALVIGVIDDKLNAQSKDVSPYLRFLINILCAVIIVGSGVTIPFITNPFGGILFLDSFSLPFFPNITLPLSSILAVIWIIWVMNMLNWSKGVDGQMPGVVAISAIVIGLVSLRFPATDPTQLIDAKLSFIIAGSCLGFLLYNFSPAKIFPGYGATSVYLLLAVVSMLSSAKLATAILVMGVPIVDAVFTIVRRLLNRKSPFLGDNMHLHHMLLRLGYNHRQIALFYWTISAILGGISLTLQSRSKLFAILMLVVIAGGVLLSLYIIMRQPDEKRSS